MRDSVLAAASVFCGLTLASHSTGADGSAFMPDVRAYHAVCDGETDDSDALTKALWDQAGKALHLPEGRVCYTSFPLVLFGGSLYSEALPLQNPPGYAGVGGGVIRCAAGVSPCVTMAGGGSTTGAPMLRNVAVLGMGTPMPGQVGLLVSSTYNAVLEGVLVQNYANAIKIQAVGTSGISAKLRNVETCKITENDLIIDSWPEVRVDMMRFGCNGDMVTRSGAYLLLTGGVTGPNTLMVENSQFNAGAGGAKCLIKFANFGAGQESGIISEFTIAHNHFEVGHAGESGICSDSSVDVIQRLTLNGNWFLNAGAGNKFLDLDPNTAIWNWTIGASNHFVGWTGGWNVSSTKPTNNLILNGNHFENTPVSIAGVGHSVVLAEDNLFEGLTISGDFYKARFGGINNGPLTNTAVGAITDF